LHAIRAALEGDDDVRRFFLSPVFDRKRKIALLAGILEGKVDEIALHTLLLLVRKRREALLPLVVSEYDDLALADAGKERLEVVSARALPPAELAEIVARLSRRYGKRFEVTERVDPSLLGGIRITMGDLRVDGSIAGRLEQLARELSTNVPAEVAGSSQESTFR